MIQTTFVPLTGYPRYPEAEMKRRAGQFYASMRERRTVRHFSGRSVPREIIDDCLRAANTAPSGANRQPWHFVVVTDSTLKARIREGAEDEERAFYHGRAPNEWLEAVAPLGTDEHKPFLQTAPYLIVIFSELYGWGLDEKKIKHYYVQESVGIATGLLVTALHHAGLASLTHTPSPMSFLSEMLGRPASERPFLILVVGYPAEDAIVPLIKKKPLAEVVTHL